MNDQSSNKFNVADYIDEVKAYYLKQRCNWSFVSDYYQSSVLAPQGQLIYGENNDEIVLFVLIQSSLARPPCIGGFHYGVVSEQCYRQGFDSALTIQLIWGMIKSSNLGSETENVVLEESDAVVKFKLKLSTHMTVTLETDIVQLTDPSLVQILNGSLLRQLILGGKSLSNQLQTLKPIIQGKDRVIRFLTDTIDDLGGSELIRRWAPVNSTNYEFLGRADEVINKIGVPSTTGEVDELGTGYFVSKLLKLGSNSNISSNTFLPEGSDTGQKLTKQQGNVSRNDRDSSYDSFGEVPELHGDNLSSDSSTDTDVSAALVASAESIHKRNPSSPQTDISPSPKKRKFKRVTAHRPWSK